jgi:hypothetical protein
VQARQRVGLTRWVAPCSARLAIRRSLCARQCSRVGEIPPFCDSDHRRGVGPVRG